MSSRKELANAIRALSMDAVQKAKSGHPGAPMGMADIAEVLWRDFLNHNPNNPAWADRDRFVLSNGHGSMLIYSLLHLTGYDLLSSGAEAFQAYSLSDAQVKTLSDQACKEMDAKAKIAPATRVPRWVWLTLPKCCGVIS